MLTSLNRAFLQSSKKTKIELYLLPFLIAILFFAIFSNNMLEKGNIPLQYNIRNEFTNKKLEQTLIEISNSIEEIAKESGIEIIKNTNLKDEIFIQAKATINSLIVFLRDVENINSFSKIKNLSFEKNSDVFTFDLYIDFSQFFIKNLNKNKEIIEIKDNFNIYKIEKYEKEIIKNTDFTINAIIGDFAFINNIWLKLQDEIEGYKLILIKEDYILLKKGDKTIKLEVNVIESFENFD